MSNKKLAICIVKFNPDGDGQDAMYIDGKLHIDGDEYHDKIGTWIEAFLAGLTYCDKKFTLSTRYVPDNDEGYFDFPEKLDTKWKIKK